MKRDWKTIGLVVAILLNVFQFISDEAQEWYALTQQAKPSVRPTKEHGDINRRMAGRIDKDNNITSAKGVK